MDFGLTNVPTFGGPALILVDQRNIYSRGKTLRIGKLCAPVWDIIKSYKKGNLPLAQQLYTEYNDRIVVGYANVYCLVHIQW